MTDAIVRPLHADARLTWGVTTRAFSGVDEPLDDVRARLGLREGFAQVASVGQVHGADVATVASSGHVPEHDGLATATPGVLLTVLAADCALVLLADTTAGVVGACHSGWRGAVANVTAATVAAMVRLGAEPARVCAFVGPCLSAKAFEVGEEVAAQFSAASVVRRPEWPRPHVDLRAEIGGQLAAAGVRRVEASAACTAGEPGRWFSYRAEAGRTGRMLGFVGLRPERG